MSVLSYINKVSDKLVLSEFEKASINESIKELEKKIEGYFPNIIDKFCFGSYTRDTILPGRIDEKSDIDYMIIFDNSNGHRPKVFIEELISFVEDCYSAEEIYYTDEVVILNLNNVKIELVPAYKSWLSFHIPKKNSEYNEWASTDPIEFNKVLLRKDKTNGNMMIKLIRLVKYWNCSRNYIFPSYKLERDLVDQNYFLCSNLKDYFLTAMDNLPVFELNPLMLEKIYRVKNTVGLIRYLEANQKNAEAEEEVKKLLPELEED